MIRLYYWDYPNFGDQLSRYLIEKITGKPVVYSPPPFDNITLLAVGSLIDPSVLRKNVVIWGTGTLQTTILDRPSLKLFPVNRLIRQIKDLVQTAQPRICAVRGPRTRDILQNRGLYCPNVFGDPAILLPKYYMPRKKLTRNPIGLILHHTQHLTREQLAFCANIGIRTISIFRKKNNEIENFIEEVCACERVFSSSLHGLIVAQTYGIPAQWIRLKNNSIHADDWHKFEDYFLGACQEPQKALDIDLSDRDLLNIQKIVPPKIKRFAMADALLDSFPNI